MIKAGAFAIDITPVKSLQLAGYPFVERMSTGVHDPLLASALFIDTGNSKILFISCDLLFVGKETATKVRKTIEREYGIPLAHIMVSATHTHSGPSITKFIAGAHDKLLKPVDEKYLAFVTTQLILAAAKAIATAQPAAIGFETADVRNIGTNRHDPNGPTDLEAPIMLVKNIKSEQLIACMVTCSMHPTVLHEDSTLYSGDFPGIARSLLKKSVLPDTAVFIYQLGTAGDQSPRHITKQNNFEEAERLGVILADAIIKKIPALKYDTDLPVAVQSATVQLMRRKFPSLQKAKAYEGHCKNEWDLFIKSGKSRQKIRSAEVNWFGAKELLHLVELQEKGLLEKTWQEAEETEILVFEIGEHKIVGWPGEVFVEYGLQIKKANRNTSVITLVNGELQGYIVSKTAAEKGVYEASNGIFAVESGNILVTQTQELLNNL